MADFKKLVGWLRDTDPKFLFVDWAWGHALRLETIVSRELSIRARKSDASRPDHCTSRELA